MTDLIYPPFTLHGIEVGPSLEAAQLGPSSTGLYVRTLQTWLIELGYSLTGDAFGTFGEKTLEAVMREQRYLGLSDTGHVNTRLWTEMQASLFTGLRAVLPRDPDELRPPFPTAPDFEEKLHSGLTIYGIEYEWPAASRIERDDAVRLFKRLARDNPQLNPKETPDLPSERFWRQQWARFQPTWGRLVGAPWLGVSIEEHSVPSHANWGARPLLREILRAGRTYLLAAKNTNDLRHRLAHPIRIRSINRKYTFGYSFVMHLPKAAEATDYPTALAWLEALRDTSPHRILSSDHALVQAYNRERFSLPFVGLDAAHDRSPLSHITWIRLHESTDETYSALEKAWPDMLPGVATTPEGEALNTIRRLNIATGAHLPFGYRHTLPDRSMSLINGYIGTATRDPASPLIACAAILTRHIPSEDITVTPHQGITPTKISLATFLQRLPPENPAFFEALQQSGYTCTFLLARPLTHGERYNFSIRCNSTPALPPLSWAIEAPPAAIDHRGISFLAASCYCDFNSFGTLATPAGEVYALAVSRWLAYTQLSLASFFRPLFKALCGDNVYLDVAPDFLYTEASSLFRRVFLFPGRNINNPDHIPLLLDPATSTLGKYIRYTSLSAYAQHLATLPSVAIPDDHEFWNDFERKQFHAERSRSDFQLHAATSRDAFRLFQGAMTPSVVEALATPDSDNSPSIPPISDICRYSLIGSTNSEGCSIFFLDTTSTRKYKTWAGIKERDVPDRLLADEALDRFKKWLSELKSPGIIVVGQPFLAPAEFKLDTPVSFNAVSFTWLTADYHPSAFPAELAPIIDAISTSSWDIAIITGDVHWSRLSSCDASHLSRLYATKKHPGFLASQHQRINPSVHEIISSPAQRLATRETLFSSAYNRPDYDHPRQMYATGPWTDSDRDYDAPPGPRVTAASYESPTFASIRIQPIHRHAARLDVAFCNKEGRIALREEQYFPAVRSLSDDPRDLAHTTARWLVPNEWVTVEKVPVSLWRSFDIGAAANPENERAYYPNGSHDTYNGQGPEHAARLPPLTSSEQFVRALELGERMLVKRVLYQAIRTRRGDAVEREYQCVEVATMHPDTAGHDGMLDQSYFVWSIYNGETYLSPIKEHLYSVVLRKRMPWFEFNDRIVTLRGGGHLWDKTHVQWPNGKSHENSRFEWGHIARAPLTTTPLRDLAAGVKAIVQRVFFQAEQVYLASEARLAGAYQVLEIEIERGPDSSGPVERGLYWSVYDGEEWACIQENPGSAVEKKRPDRQRATENLNWLRSTAGSSHQALAHARYLELFEKNPTNLGEELRLFRGRSLSLDDRGGLALLYAWAKASAITLIDHVANVVEYNHYLEKERIKEGAQGIEEEVAPSDRIEARAYRKLRLGNERVEMKAEARLGTVFDVLLESHRLLIEKSSRGGIDYDLLASNLRSLLETSVTRVTLVSLPPFEHRAAATLVFGHEFPAGLPQTFVLLSPIEDHEGSLSFTYWPNEEGVQQVVRHISKSAFQVAWRAVLHVFPRPGDGT